MLVESLLHSGRVFVEMDLDTWCRRFGDLRYGISPSQGMFWKETRMKA